jgi:hypothetical protein
MKILSRLPVYILILSRVGYSICHTEWHFAALSCTELYNIGSMFQEPYCTFHFHFSHGVVLDLKWLRKPNNNWNIIFNNQTETVMDVFSLKLLVFIQNYFSKWSSQNCTALYISFTSCGVLAIVATLNHSLLKA